MYAPYFGLSQDPFSIAPDPRYLFMSERHREALAHLLYGLDGGGGFVLLTGEIGAGKTTVCRCFLEQLPANCNVAYIVNPQLTAAELVQAVCNEFGITSPSTPASTPPSPPTVRQSIDQLNSYLLQAHAQGRNCVLVVDEAQLLSASVLEQLRLLTNLETNERKLLQIILIGQPELRGMLARPELEQLAQRVIARFHLDALSADETVQYITHRLAVAGWSGPLPFNRAALRQVHQRTRGVPRRINLLCGRALLGAYATGQRMVNRAMVEKAAQEVFGATSATAEALTQRRRRMGWAAVLVVLATGAAATVTLWGPLSATPYARAFRGAPLPPVTPVPPIPATEPAPTAPVAAAPAAPVLDAAGLARALPALERNEGAAWQTLGPRWGLEPAAATDTLADPCPRWAQQNVQCFKSSRTSLAQIRLLNRPGVLTLVDANGRSSFVTLTGLTGSHAEVALNGVLHHVPLDVLAGVWRGDFATLWRSAPGYPGPRGVASSAPVAEWLSTQLASLPGGAGAGSADDALKPRLYRFQLAQGLTPDGRAGPMTFMQLNRALGIDEPRLQTPATAER